MLKAVSASRGPSLSKNWEVSKAHKGAYSGGKVQLSSDGRFVACLYEDDVSFLDVEEGVVTKRLRSQNSEGTEEEIVSFTLHPNDREIVTASRSLLLRHWDIRTGECKRAIKAYDHRVLCMDYDGTGTLVATGSSDHTIKVWDVERGYCTHNFRGHTGIVSVVAFHPDSKKPTLVSGSEDASVRLWDLNKQMCIATLKAHLSFVTSVAFLFGGAGVVSGGRDRVLNVWDMESKELLKTFPVYEEVEGLQVIPETGEFSGKFPSEANGGGLIAVAGKNGVVRVFAVDGQPVDNLAGHHASAKATRKKQQKQQKFKSTGTASASSSSALAVPLKKLTFRCVMTQDNRSASHKAGYTALLLDPKRGGLVGITSDHNLLLLQPHSSGGGEGEGENIVKGRGFPSPVLETRRQIVGYNDEVIDIKSVPEGVLSDGGQGGESWVAVATNSPQVRLLELGGFSFRLLDGHSETVLALDVAPDGRHLCSSSKDRTCLLWDLELGVPVVRWSGHADAVGAVAASRKPGPWSPTAANGGAFVVSGAADRTLQRWDVPCKALAVLEEDARESRSLAAAAAVVGLLDTGGDGGDGGDATINAAAGGNTSTAADWKPPSPLLETARRSVRGHEKDINCVAVSPNDAIVASASQDRTVKLWRSRDLELMGVLKGHKRGVWKVEFSPVDRCVATCSGDRTVKIWSISDYSCLRTFQGHTASVLSVAFVSAGTQLVSGGADGLLKVWTVRSDECEATLDAHTDKVWALTTALAPPKRSRLAAATKTDAEQMEEEMEGDEGEEEEGVGPNNGLVVVSGGADSVINVWKDVTAREEEKVIAEKETTLLKEQELYNRLRAKDYGPAIGLALELKRPQRLWSVLRDAMTEGMGESFSAGSEEATTEMSSHRLDKYVACWSMETIAQCLNYCKDWNTNARKSIVVHALLGSMLRCVSISSLKELPGCAELVRVLLPYSDRHFQRLDRLLQSSYLVEHTLASMKMLVAAGDNSNTNRKVEDRGFPLERPLVREMKRLRDCRRPGEGDTVHGSGGKGVDPDAEMVDSGSDVEGGTGLPTPLSEIVDGKMVFNVRLEPSRGDGIGSEDDYSSGSERGGEDEDVAIREGIAPVEGDSGMKKRPKRKNSASKGNGETDGVISEGVGEEAVAAVGGAEDDESGKPRMKRKRKRGSGGDAASGGIVEIEKQRDEDGTVEKGDVDGRGEDEEASAGSSKKKKKRRRRSAPSAGVADAAEEGDGRQGVAETANVETRQEGRRKENEGEGVGREEGGLGEVEKEVKKVGSKKKRRKSAS